MTKNEFLQYIHKKLKRFGSDNADNAVAYYDEILDDKINNDNMSEEQAVESLGSPKKVVADTVADMVINNKTKNPKRTAIFVLIGVCATPVLLPLAITIFALYIVLYTVWISLIISFGACALALPAGGIMYIIANSNIGGGITILGLSLIGAVILAVLCYCVTVYGGKVLNRLTVSIYKKIRKDK